jgi:quinol monooxygenase YgiN
MRGAMAEQDVGYVVVDTWRVKPGKEGEIAAVLAEVRQRFLTAPGVVSIDFAHIEGDPGRYLVVFRYRDAAAREAFVATDDLKATMTRLRELWDFDGTSHRGVPMQRAG